jgi:rhodanese-related sulfurtransferase
MSNNKKIEDISPEKATELLEKEKDRIKLIDIRECFEFEEERIPGACLLPMRSLAEEEFSHAKEDIGIFYCRSGRRTSLASPLIAKTGFKQVYILKGGLKAWKKAGFPILKKQDKIPYLIRQVFIILGISLILFSLLSLKINLYFIGGAFIIGCGLLWAGISGNCLLAFFISQLPWNKKPHRYKII